MIKTVKKIGSKVSVAAFIALSTVGLVGSNSYALDVNDGINDAKADSAPPDLELVIGNIIDVLLYAIGLLSVVMLIVGGIRYTISNGAQDKVTLAKNTIMYSIVGLIIAFLAYAIIHWVIANLD